MGHTSHADTLVRPVCVWYVPAVQLLVHVPWPCGLYVPALQIEHALWPCVLYVPAVQIEHALWPSAAWVDHPAGQLLHRGATWFVCSWYVPAGQLSQVASSCSRCLPAAQGHSCVQRPVISGLVPWYVMRHLFHEADADAHTSMHFGTHPEIQPPQKRGSSLGVSLTALTSWILP